MLHSKETATIPKCFIKLATKVRQLIGSHYFYRTYQLQTEVLHRVNAILVKQRG